MNNSLLLCTTNLYMSNFTPKKTQEISKRYYSAVKDLIEKIDYLTLQISAQNEINSVMKVLSKLLKPDFSIENFIKYDYINLDVEVRKFLGGFSLMRRILDCKYKKKMQHLIITRIVYLIDELSKSLNIPSLNILYGEKDYNTKFTKTFGKILLGLYDKGLRNFSSMELHGLDLSNRIFEEATFYGSTFNNSDLENIKFIKCILDKCSLSHIKKGNGIVIDKNCSLYLTNFYSRLAIFKMQIYAPMDKVRFHVVLKEGELTIFLKMYKHIYDGLNLLQDEKFDEFARAYNAILGSSVAEHIFLSGTIEFNLELDCPITLTRVDLSDLCGVKYNKTIRLFSMKALSTWMERCPTKCPLRIMSLNDMEKNLLNLKELQKLLCLT